MIQRVVHAGWPAPTAAGEPVAIIVAGQVARILHRQRRSSAAPETAQAGGDGPPCSPEVRP